MFDCWRASCVMFCLCIQSTEFINHVSTPSPKSTIQMSLKVAYEQLSKHALPLYQPLTTSVPLNMWYQTCSAYLRTIYGHLRIIQQSPPQNNFKRNKLSFFFHRPIQRSSAIISGHFWLFPQSGLPSYKLVYWFIRYVYEGYAINPRRKSNTSNQL